MAQPPLIASTGGASVVPMDVDPAPAGPSQILLEPSSLGINISIEDANVRSNPLPGPELTQLAEQARRCGALPGYVDISAARLIDGKWMLPAVCQA
jgi:hypothetical protein